MSLKKYKARRLKEEIRKAEKLINTAFLVPHVDISEDDKESVRVELTSLKTTITEEYEKLLEKINEGIKKTY